MSVKLKASSRKDFKNSSTKKIRSEGFIPAVVYGNDKESQSIAVNSIQLLKTIRDEGRNAIISLDVEDKSVDVMLHDYQVEPITGQLIHADFIVVNMKQEMDVSVPIHLEGEAKGTKDGGVLQQPLYELSVRAKPADIPEEIKVDVSALEIGDSIMVADLKEGKNFEILEDENATIVTVTVPTEEPEEVVVDEDAEPEVINEKGTEEA